MLRQALIPHTEELENWLVDPRIPKPVNSGKSLNENLMGRPGTLRIRRRELTNEKPSQSPRRALWAFQTIDPPRCLGGKHLEGLANLSPLIVTCRSVSHWSLIFLLTSQKHHSVAEPAAGGRYIQLDLLRVPKSSPFCREPEGPITEKRRGLACTFSVGHYPPGVEIGSWERQKKSYNITVVCGPQRATVCLWGRTIRRKVLKGGVGGHENRLGNPVPESQRMCCRKAGFTVLLEVPEALPRSPWHIVQAGTCLKQTVLCLDGNEDGFMVRPYSPGFLFPPSLSVSFTAFLSVSCFLLCPSLLVRCLQTR